MERVAALKSPSSEENTSGPETTPRLHPESWVDEYGDLMFRYAVLCLRDRAAAEDVVQETFLSAWNGRAGFRGKGSEKGWLMGILKRKIIDHFRQRSRESFFVQTSFHEEPFKDPFHQEGVMKRGNWKKEESPQHWHSPDQSLTAKEFWEGLYACCEKLPPKVARVFFLRELEQKDSGEIRELLNISPNHFWVLMHRARTALRSCLEKNWFNR